MLQDSPMYVYLPATNVACFLYPTRNAGTNRASQAYWQVTDLEREVAELKARGVTFEEYDMPGIKTDNGVITMPDGSRGAWFKDCEGNILSITTES